MKKFFSFIVVVAIAAAVFYFFFYNKTKDVDLGSEKIEGALSEYYKVVANDYEINGGVINVKLEKTADGFPEPWKDGMEIGYAVGQVEPVFGIEFIGETGEIICKEETDMEEMDMLGDESLRTVSALVKGETASLAFAVAQESDMGKVGTIKITSRLVYHEPAAGEAVETEL